jgi:hypothetical protein
VSLLARNSCNSNGQNTEVILGLCSLNVLQCFVYMQCLFQISFGGAERVSCMKCLLV